MPSVLDQAKRALVRLIWEACGREAVERWGGGWMGQLSVCTAFGVGMCKFGNASPLQKFL